MSSNKEELLGAVNALIRSPDAQSLYDAMLAVANLAMTQPVGLVGNAAIVNPLLDLRRQNPDKYDRVLELVEARRAEAGFSPLQRPASDKFDKSDYMREFMDRKRQRQRRAVEIENIIRPGRDKLVGRARLDFMDRQAAKWKVELDAMLENAREKVGGRLAKDVMVGLRDQFWAKIDTELDELDELARKESLNPSRTVAASMTNLERALRDDPYKK